MMLRSVYVYIYVMTTPKHQPIKINDYTVKNQSINMSELYQVEKLCKVHQERAKRY